MLKSKFSKAYQDQDETNTMTGSAKTKTKTLRSKTKTETETQKIESPDVSRSRLESRELHH